MRSSMFVALGIVSGLMACGEKEGDTASSDRQSDILSLSGDAANGEALFQSMCTSCHGSDGSGASGPNLYDRVPLLDESSIVEVLLDGTSGGMPGYSGTLEDQEIADLLAYLLETYDS